MYIIFISLTLLLYTCTLKVNTEYMNNSQMSDFLSPVKDKAILSMGCVSPIIQKSFTAQGLVSMSLEGRTTLILFLLELAETKRNSDLSYTEILNFHLSGIGLNKKSG